MCWRGRAESKSREGTPENGVREGILVPAAAAENGWHGQVVLNMPVPDERACGASHQRHGKAETAQPAHATLFCDLSRAPGIALIGLHQIASDIVLLGLCPESTATPETDRLTDGT